jgi:hypothetical protein
MAADAPALPSGFDPLIAEAKRRTRRRRYLAAVALLAVVAGVTGAVIALTSSSGYHGATPWNHPGGFQAAAVCPGTGSRVYEVDNPAHSATTPPWPNPNGDAWGWMPVRHALKVGDRIRLNVHGPLWLVGAIAALPIDCKFFGISPRIGAPSWEAGGLLGGRLILRAVR